MYPVLGTISVVRQRYPAMKRRILVIGYVTKLREDESLPMTTP
jgi:hypothetical protein